MARIFLLLLGGLLLGFSQNRPATPVVPNGGFVPKEGFVPTARVAETLAEALLAPVYGTQVVQSERPFNATPNGNIWVVKGSVPCDGPAGAVCPGGAAEVWISRRTGQVLYMTHDQ